MANATWALKLGKSNSLLETKKTPDLNFQR